MKKKLVDALVIIGIGTFLMAIIYFGWISIFIKFSVVPMVTVYFLGQYVGRKFASKND